MKSNINGIFFSDNRIGLLLLLMGAFLRIFYALTLEIAIPIRGDAVAYLQYASNLLDYGVFSKDGAVPPVPDSYWAPGYPVFLALCYSLASFFTLDFYYFVLIVQGMMGGMTSWLTYSAGRNFLSKRYAFSAAILVVFSPHLVSLSGYFLLEALLTTLLLSGIYYFLKAWRQGSSASWGISGVFFGLAYLTNPVILFVPVLLFALYFYFHRNIKINDVQWRRSFIILLVFGIFVIFWAARDAISVPDGKSSMGGRAFVNLVIGSHENYHDIWRANPRDPENPADIDVNAYKNNQIEFIAVLIKRIAADPIDYIAWYAFGKPAELWGWDILVGYGDIYVFPVEATLYHKSMVALVSLVIMKNTHNLLLGLVFIGFFFSVREKDKIHQYFIWSIYVCLISISVIYILLHTDGRYSIPLRPEMYLCAMYGLQKLLCWVQEKHASEKQFVKLTD